MLSREIIDRLTECGRSRWHETAIETQYRCITYGELEQKSDEIRNLLSVRGIESRSVVALLMEDTVELVVAMIGIMKAGCIFVPLDPRYPVNRIRAMLATAEPRAFLVQSRFAKMAEEIVANSHGDCSIIVPAEQSPTCSGSPHGPEVLVANPALSHELPPHMGYIYFTSGSTGQPKGIAGNLLGLSHFLNWEREAMGVNEDFRVSQLTPPSFDPFLRDVFLPLSAGGTLCIPPDRETVLDAEKLVQWIDGSRITLMHCTPSLFRSLLHQPLNHNCFRSLKYIVLAGEPLFPADVKRWFKIFGDRVQLVNLYGPTETTLAKFCHFVSQSDQERRAIPVGKPIPGAEAFVLSDNRELCPAGAVGEIYIRTVYRSYGYYKQPELTREVFIQNPFNPDDPNDLIYRTGDIGRLLPEGEFELIGRKDSQVKIRGARVELGEIEKLLRDHPDVSDAAVKDWEDDDHQKFLCAYIVSENEPNVLELRRFLSQWLPEPSVPSVFLKLEELSLNLNGKIDRRALPDPRTRAREVGEYVAPRNDMERKIAETWQKILDMPRIGIHATFFSLGGHSLMATRVVALLRKEFQVPVPLRLLFEHPTVAGLAAAMQDQLSRVQRPSKGSSPAPVDGAQVSHGSYVVPANSEVHGNPAVV